MVALEMSGKRKTGTERYVEKACMNPDRSVYVEFMYSCQTFYKC